MENVAPDANAPPSMVQRIGQWLVWLAMILAVAALLLVFVVPELFEPGSMTSSDLFVAGLNAGPFALLLTLAGWITCKVARVPLPRFQLLALILGLLAAAPIVLFVIAYSNCPNGIC